MKPESPLSHRYEVLLDTLAQKRTTVTSHFARDPMLVNGLGSDLNNTEALIGRAKRKTITQAMVLSLVDVATRKNKPDRVNAYWNTYHCQSRITTSDGRLYGKYCKNRFCTLCCSIRKATLINRYFPVVATWEDCHLVTLTVKAIPAKELVRYCKGMIKLFGKIIDKYRKRRSRGHGQALTGIRALECNFNPKTRTYNPHFHVLVRTREMGETLIGEWLKRFPRKYASPFAQHIRKVDDRVSDLIEIIKYGSKIFTEPDITKRSKEGISRYVYISALDNILSAMAGTRIFDRFGFDLNHHNVPKGNKGKVLTEYDAWEYFQDLSDWVNPDTGEKLTNFHVSRELKDILLNRIDLVLQ